nr:hypothetical protein [Streptomyces actuosus]
MVGAGHPVEGDVGAHREQGGREAFSLGGRYDGVVGAVRDQGRRRFRRGMGDRTAQPP